MRIDDKGLKILQEVAPEANIIPGHDQIWVGDYEGISKMMSEAEIKEMEKLDWFESDGCWSHFC